MIQFRKQLQLFIEFSLNNSQNKFYGIEIHAGKDKQIFQA